LMTMSPRTLPMLLAVKRKEYSVYGTFRDCDKKGMMGPMLPVTKPSVYDARQ
jgi:hypothetical protein